MPETPNNYNDAGSVLMGGPGANFTSTSGLWLASGGNPRSPGQDDGTESCFADGLGATQSRVLAVVGQGPKGRLGHVCKRILDVVVAALLLTLLLPLLIGIGICIRFGSSGPAIFSQSRIGSRRRTKDGRVIWEIRAFKCHKFRTMCVNADQGVHSKFVQDFCRKQSPAGAAGEEDFKLENDPRVTWFGRVLRRTSLDELPQLLNVLKGEMSLVGPRPVPEYEVAEYHPRHYQRLAALPGITGLWQVQGRGRVTFEEMVKLDIEYTRRSSFFADLKILLLTLPAVVSGRGAK